MLHYNATFLPAASRYVPIVLCAVCPRVARTNRTQKDRHVPCGRRQKRGVVMPNDATA